MGRRITFRSIIQIRHIASGGYITLNHRELGEKNGSLKLRLSR